MKHKLLLSVLLYTLNLACLTASAAPLGAAFNYQGQLQESVQPAQGLYDFQFSLWDDVSDGNLVGATQAKSVALLLSALPIL